MNLFLIALARPAWPEKFRKTAITRKAIMKNLSIYSEKVTDRAKRMGGTKARAFTRKESPWVRSSVRHLSPEK